MVAGAIGFATPTDAGVFAIDESAKDLSPDNFGPAFAGPLFFHSRLLQPDLYVIHPLKNLARKIRAKLCLVSAAMTVWTTMPSTATTSGNVHDMAGAIGRAFKC